MTTTLSQLSLLDGNFLRDAMRAGAAKGRKKEEVVEELLNALSDASLLITGSFDKRRAIIRKALMQERYNLINGLVQKWKPRWQLQAGKDDLRLAVPSVVFSGATEAEDIDFLIGEGILPAPMDANTVALLTAIRFDFNSLPESLRNLPRQEPTANDVECYRRLIDLD